MKSKVFLHNIRMINLFVLKPIDHYPHNDSSSWKLSLFTTAFLYHIVIGGLLGAAILYVIDRFFFPIENNIEVSVVNLFAIVLIAPFMEELLFRWPLRYRGNYLIATIEATFNINLYHYWKRHFHLIVYSFACLFAVLHLTNYQNQGTSLYLMGTFMILPQLIGGLTLSFTRLRLGFWWAVAQHSLYNLVFTLLIIAV